MSLETVATSGVQAVVGLIGVGVGGVKVTGQDDQIEEFQRYGYPQWFRIVTGGVEVVAGIALLAGIVWLPEFALAGGVLFTGVMAGAVLTHLRISDPLSKVAIPAILLIVTIILLAQLYSAVP